MRPSAHPPASLWLKLLAAALIASACGGADTRDAAIRGEKLMLQKQIAGLHTLIGALQRGTLTAPNQMLVGADEATVERLIAVTLPQERLVNKRFRIRLEKAKVQFRGNQGIVTLTGRATSEDAPSTFVDVVLKGALNDLAVMGNSGALTGRVAIYALEIQRAAAVGAENDAVRRLAKALGQARIDSLAELGPTVVIPIRLHEDLDFHGLDEEPVSAAPGSLHVRLSVAKVIAVSGRIWVMLDVVAGPWLSKDKDHSH